VEFAWMARTVCCGVFEDTGEAREAEMKTSEQFLVCSDNCRKFVEMAAA